MTAVNPADTIRALQEQLEAQKQENARLRARGNRPMSPAVVRAPADVQPIFDRAAAALGAYFERMEVDPSRAMIGIDDERFVLVRASAFSIDFLDTLVALYADRGQREALAISRGFLFDIAHTIGVHDARRMHEHLGSLSPLERLSGGPVHFAYTGWGLVEIKASSHPSPDDDYCLVYEHTYSFEAASFLRAGRSSEGPVCIMQAGYSSGWCEASFGLELTAVEVECKARGDAACMFVMAPPKRVTGRVREHFNVDLEAYGKKGFDVPTYFERKRVEEDLRDSLRKLKEAQDELVRKERLATVGLLVAGVAHEINTPLGVAVTATSVVNDELAALQTLFDEGKLTRGDLRHHLERARQAGTIASANLDRAAAEITQFKLVSIDQVAHEHRSIDVGVYIRQTAESLRPVLRTAKVVLDLECEGDLVIDTYPGAIAQIVTNLVTNTAAHARSSPEGSPEDDLHVRVELRRSERHTILFTYSDNGRGMTEAVRRQAFQPFFTTARGGGGTGLGLHIVHSLVTDVLRGTLALTSAPGAGVRFDIELSSVAPVDVET